jgi:hypothetical protein
MVSEFAASDPKFLLEKCSGQKTRCGGATAVFVVWEEHNPNATPIIERAGNTKVGISEKGYFHMGI